MSPSITLVTAAVVMGPPGAAAAPDWATQTASGVNANSAVVIPIEILTHHFKLLTVTEGNETKRLVVIRWRRGASRHGLQPGLFGLCAWILR